MFLKYDNYIKDRKNVTIFLGEEINMSSRADWRTLSPVYRQAPPQSRAVATEKPARTFRCLQAPPPQSRAVATEPPTIYDFDPFLGRRGEITHTNPPNKFAQEAGVELGLTRLQVRTQNFGSHTIHAIKSEIEKDKNTNLEEAFSKYKGLNNIQVEGMTSLGLTGSQVRTQNFDFHTIKAINDIRKRTETLSVTQAFEMVSGKSFTDTQEVMVSYLESTKKVQKPITEMNLIRVIVKNGRGFGHQRAAITLMQKLREMGFKGTFDVQCSSRDVKDRVESMIKGVSKLKISLFSLYEKTNVFKEKADLAVCAADDVTALTEKDTIAKIYNSQSYIGLQPTNWDQGSCFTVDQSGVITTLPSASEMRLSSVASYQQTNINSIKTSDIEKKVLEIVNDSSINSQLVYGLYPEKKINKENGRLEISGNLDEVTEMKLIVDANLKLSQRTGKTAILLLPQEIALDLTFKEKVKGINTNVHFIDLTKDKIDKSLYTAGDVVIAYTGVLQQVVFDYLMLEGTTLPPVIEGCNSTETVNSSGRPFIHGSSININLQTYPVTLNKKQDLHKQASLCLEQGKKECLPQLIQYMEEALNLNAELFTYHEQRRDAFLERPEACEVAFKTLGISWVSGTKSLGAVVNAMDHNGNTPLHLALEQGNTEVVNALNAVGANVDAQNNNGCFARSKTSIEKMFKSIKKCYTKS